MINRELTEEQLVALIIDDITATMMVYDVSKELASAVMANLAGVYAQRANIKAYSAVETLVTAYEWAEANRSRGLRGLGNV